MSESAGGEGEQQQAQLRHVHPRQAVTHAEGEEVPPPPSLPPLQSEEGSPTGISDAFGSLDAEREGDELSLSRPVLPGPAAVVGGRGRGAAVVVSPRTVTL